MEIIRGTGIDNPIKITNGLYLSDEIILNEIETLFGSKDEAYFIINTQAIQLSDKRRFKIVYVEDKDRIKHSVFFQLV